MLVSRGGGNLAYRGVWRGCQIKCLLIGMLACTALVGCSDNDIIDDNGNENVAVEKREAYLTFSIASSTNSSRGVNGGTTTGDGHQNEEHSGHESEGTAAENQVNDILIAFYNTQGDDGYCGLFTMKSADSNGNVESDELTYNSYSTKLTKQGDDTYSLSEPFALNSLGEYKLLVIINPAQAIKTIAGSTGTGASNVSSFYENIIKGEASSVEAIIGVNKNNFMMANRKEIIINVTSANNDPATAANKNGDPIEVERVVSKITFRHKKTASGFETIGSITDGENLYTITETKYNYNIVTSNFWFKNRSNIYDYLTNLYKAEDPEGNVYWVYVDAGGNTIRYTDGGVQHTGDLADEVNVTANIVTTSDYTGTLVYVGSKVATEKTESYYIQLKRYALVNLNNKVYYVRHTSATPTTATDSDAWGTVSSTNYLIEPNTKSKSEEDFTNLTAWTAASTYYNNDFTTMTNKIAEGNLTAFNNFATDSEETAMGAVTPSETGESVTTPEETEVGTLMDYCLENSVLATNQNVLTSTGVIFEAQMYDKEGKVVDHMLGWNGSYYPSFLALAEASATDDNDITTSPFWAYTDEDYAKMTAKQKTTLATTLASEGVTLYQDGKCYYFSAGIKHFDYGTEKKGVMEYAIMRNNIYSLAVSSVDGFGFSSIDLQSGVLKNSGSETEKVYLTMSAKIMPWVVRFNNITF